MTRAIAERLLRATYFTEFQICRLIDERETLDDDFIARVIEINMSARISS
jgi:hypothetical protein